MKKILVAISIFLCSISIASELKVFGTEFCNQYDAGACINFHYEKLKDAKNLFGQYKYPKGKKAYEQCAENSPPSDGALAYCSMLFHKAEQTESQKLAMCDKKTISKYMETIRGTYAMHLYLDAWKCSDIR